MTISAKARDYRAAELQAIDPATWTQEDQDAYLGYALWSLFSAVEIYKDVMGCLPADAQFLVDVGYLKTWPLNPYNDWQPCRLLISADGFSPGDILWQPSPDEPMAYELCIYGADPALPVPARCQPLPGHEEWAQVPAGVRYMAGGYGETYSDWYARVRERRNSR